MKVTFSYEVSSNNCSLPLKLSKTNKPNKQLHIAEMLNTSPRNRIVYDKV